MITQTTNQMSIISMKIRQITEHAILNGALEERISIMGHITNAREKLEASQLPNTHLTASLSKNGRRLWKLKDKRGSIAVISVKLPEVNTNKPMVSSGNTFKER